MMKQRIASKPSVLLLVATVAGLLGPVRMKIESVDSQ